MAKHTSSNDLAGATPVPVSDSVAVAAQIKGSARARKTPDAGPDYAALGVPDALVKEMERLRRAFVDLGRRSTGQVFDWGGAFTKCASSLRTRRPSRDGRRSFSGCHGAVRRTMPR